MKLTKYSMFIFTAIGLFFSFCFGIEWTNGELDGSFPYKSSETSVIKCDGYTDLGNCISVKEDEKFGGKDTILRRLLGTFGLDNSKNRDLKFIDYAKAIMNLALGLVSFIALIMTIYTFYLMIFSQNEKGIEKAKGNLVGIFIALAIIGFARLIVSVIFWWYQNRWKENEEYINTNNAISMSNINQIYLTI